MLFIYLFFLEEEEYILDILVLQEAYIFMCEQGPLLTETGILLSFIMLLYSFQVFFWFHEEAVLFFN